MRSKLCQAALLGCGVLWLDFSAALAQIAPGYSGDSTTMTYSGSVAWRELGTFGKCYASRNKDHALALIGTEPGSRSEMDVYKAMFRSQNQSCLGSITDMRAPPTMVRGAIAEGLYKQHVPLPGNLMLAAPVKDEAIVNLTGAARCLVARHPEEVSTMLRTTWPGSREEGESVQRLMPTFEKCVPANAKVTYSSTRLRFRFAEVLYRMNMTQPGPVVGAN